MSSIIVVRELSYHLPNGRDIFSELNFSLDASLTALVGSNGVGKTILGRLLAGDLVPTGGTVRREGPVTLVRQRELPDDITVEEYLATAPEWSLQGARLLHGIDHAASCRTLSGGEWMRVRLARALTGGFLVLDEPTNDLDRSGRETIEQILRSHRGGALLISHDRELLSSCSRVMELSNRGLTMFGGDWQSYEEARDAERDRHGQALDRAKRERDRHVARQSELQQRQAKRERRGRAAAARGGTPTILLGARKRRAQETTGRHEAAALERAQAAVRDVHIALSEIKNDAVMSADVAGCEIPAQKLVAEARDFNIRIGDWLYDDDLTFSWRGNVRVALRGDNGAGKSTLLRALMGSDLETRGTFRRGELIALAIDQPLSRLDPTRSVFDNVSAYSGRSDSELRTGLSHFLFAGDAVFQRVGELSGGERLRAALAQGFLAQQRPELVVLDEPTNNLDLRNIEFLENVMRHFHGAVIVVSHDERFLERCQLDDELVVRRRRS